MIDFGQVALANDVSLRFLYQIQGKNSFLESENPFSRFYYTEKVEFDLSSGL